jgi:hypothetical protein
MVAPFLKAATLAGSSDAVQAIPVTQADGGCADKKKPDDPAQSGGSIGQCTQERDECQGESMNARMIARRH